MKSLAQNGEQNWSSLRKEGEQEGSMSASKPDPARSSDLFGKSQDEK